MFRSTEELDEVVVSSSSLNKTLERKTDENDLFRQYKTENVVVVVVL